MTTQTTPRWLVAMAMLLVLTVVMSSFALSFTVLRDLAALSGIPEGVAWLWPVIVDGTITAATLVLYTSRGEGRRRALSMTTLVIFALASVVGNVAHIVIVSPSDLVPVAIAVFVGVMPPVGLILTVELLGSLLRPKQALSLAVPTQPDATTTVANSAGDSAVASVDAVVTPVVEAAQPEPEPVTEVPSVAVLATVPGCVEEPVATAVDDDDELSIGDAAADGIATEPATVSMPRLHVIEQIPADAAGQATWIATRARRGDDVSWQTLAALLKRAGHGMSDRTVQRRLSTARAQNPDAFDPQTPLVATQA